MRDEADRDLGLYTKAQLAEMKEYQIGLSEARGHAVSLEEACYAWIDTGRAERFKQDYLARLETVEPVLRRMNERGQPITAETVHRLLGDYTTDKRPEPYYSGRHTSAA